MKKKKLKRMTPTKRKHGAAVTSTSVSQQPAPPQKAWFPPYPILTFFLEKSDKFRFCASTEGEES